MPSPFGEEQVFRYGMMEDVLKLLVRNPFREFTVRQLREITDNGSKTTTRAVDLLQQWHACASTRVGAASACA